MKKILFIAILGCIAMAVRAQYWDERMYGKYTYQTYQNYAPFSYEMDIDTFDPRLLSAAIFYETNRQRAIYGRAPLKYDYALELCASNHSADMVDYDFYSHTSPVAGCRTMTERLRRVGYSNCWAGENIAYAYFRPTYIEMAEALLDMWMNSTGHRENILNSRYTHFAAGTAAYYNTEYSTYYVKATQNFVQK